MLVAGSAAIFYRSDLMVAYHRQRLATELNEWRAPPPAGESMDYRDYSGVESELSQLVSLGTLDRIELSIRLHNDSALTPLPSLNRLQNGKSPAPVFHHIKGDPRIQPQTVVIWCDPGDTAYWEQFAGSTLEKDAMVGVPTDAPASW